MGTRENSTKQGSLLSPAESGALKDITRLMPAVPGVLRVVFFGSRRRGDFRQDSDLDILVILKDLSSRDRTISVLHDLEMEYDVPISPVIYTEREYGINVKMKSGFFLNVEREGLVLYDAHQGR